MIVFVIFMLNYLIAIVSDSYANIVENEKMALIESREEQNEEYMREHRHVGEY